MEITRIDVRPTVATERANAPRDALQTLSGGGSVTVTVETKAGDAGTGTVSFGRVSGAANALAVFIEEVLVPVVIGRDLHAVRALHRAMLRETEYHGTVGFASFGVAALDTALWDCLGRSLGVPCRRLWGSVHDRIPAYAMVGWMNHSDAEVAEVCRRAVEQGFRAVKVKVGYETLDEDIARVQTVRKAVGENVGIMVDANQSLTVSEAIRRGRAFGELGCVWWEEPIPAADVDGYRRLAAASLLPIATGENLYTPGDFARFLRNDAVDIVQPDLRRIGGPTALLDVGRISAAFDKPYASHGGGPVQLNVMACLENALYLETGLIPDGSPLRITDGCVNLPEGPGFSFA